MNDETESLVGDIIRWDETVATDGPCDATWDSLAEYLTGRGWTRSLTPTKPREGAVMTNPFTAAAERREARAEDLREDLALARRLTGTYQADTSREYYPAMDRIFDALDEALAARAHLSAQEPTDAEVEAAHAAYWPAYSEAVRNAPSNKPGQGISAEDGRKAGLAGHRAALSAARAVGRDAR